MNISPSVAQPLSCDGRRYDESHELSTEVCPFFLDRRDANAPGFCKDAAVTEQSGAEETVEETSVVEAIERAAAVSFRTILVGSGPRFARDAFGPVLAFYIGWEFVSLWAGMALAVAVSMFAYLYERRRERPGLLARISLAIIGVQVAAGAISDRAEGFLAPPVIINGVYGLAFIASVVIGRPLAGVLASEMHSFPPEMRNSATFRHTFARVSLVWGVCLILRSAARFWVLTQADVGSFVVFNLVTGFPLISALVSWSVWYGVRSFRRSDEWGQAPDGDAKATDLT